MDVGESFLVEVSQGSVEEAHIIVWADTAGSVESFFAQFADMCISNGSCGV